VVIYSPARNKQTAFLHAPAPGAPGVKESASVSASSSASAPRQGLTLAHFTAQLEDLRDTSLTQELNFSTFGTNPRVRLDHVGYNVRLSSAERGRVSSS
jgi:hypothetical protein